MADTQPRPLPTASTAQVRGFDLRLWEWAARGEPEATALLVHATGFHSRTWDAVARLLPDSWRVFALDMRGHGASQDPATPQECAWREMAKDVSEWLAQRDLRGIIAAGHSMGGAVLALTAAAEPERIGALVLVDAVIPKFDDPLSTSLPPGDLAEAARKRRRIWPSPQAMAESLQGRGAFAAWPPDLIASYTRYGLAPTADSEWRLLCEPEVEAWTFEHARTTNPWPELPQITQPTTALRAAADGHPSPTSPEVASAIPNATEVLIEDSDHFIPMRRPDAVAEQIMAAVARSA